MTETFCPKCGKSISDTAFVCPNCGYHLKYNSPMPVYRVGIPGRGFAFASMFIGIYTLIITIYIGEDLTRDGGVVLSLILAILTFGFAFASNSRGYNGGQKTAGIVLGSITLVLCVLAILFPNL